MRTRTLEDRVYTNNFHEFWCTLSFAGELQKTAENKRKEEKQINGRKELKQDD